MWDPLSYYWLYEQNYRDFEKLNDNNFITISLQENTEYKKTTINNEKARHKPIWTMLAYQWCNKRATSLFFFFSFFFI